MTDLCYSSSRLLIKCMVLMVCATFPLLHAGSCVAQEIDRTYQLTPAETQRRIAAESVRRTWKIVNENFYDRKFCGQDWNRWDGRYEGRVHNLDDARVAISTMLASLGDTASFLDHCDELWQVPVAGPSAGIGITMGLTETGGLEIKRVISNSPAHRAGLQSADRIIAINQTVLPLAIPEAVKLIRGPKGTEVTLTVLREERVLEATALRDDIEMTNVIHSRMLGKVGYIWIDSLDTLDALDAFLQNLSKLKSAKALILDLRGSSAASLPIALDVAAIFIDTGVITSVVDRYGEPKWRYEVDNHRKSKSTASKSVLPLYNQPLAVLIDGNTTGNSEVLATALRQNKRTELVGQMTRGQQTIQQLFPLPNGWAINLSTLRYSPSADTDLVVGLKPDHKVEVSSAERRLGHGPWFNYLSETGARNNRGPEDAEDVQLAAAVKLMQLRLADKAGKPEISDCASPQHPFKGE